MSAGRKKPSIKSLVLDYLEKHRPQRIDEQQLLAIRRHVVSAGEKRKPTSDRYLLDILSATKVPISRSLGGLPVDLRGRVHFGDPQRAAASLLEMQQEYQQAYESGDQERADDCRRAVRQAKDRLRLLLRRSTLSPQRKREKQELLRWFLVWLETPELFEQWLRLRRREGTSDRQVPEKMEDSS